MAEGVVCEDFNREVAAEYHNRRKIFQLKDGVFRLSELIKRIDSFFFPSNSMLRKIRKKCFNGIRRFFRVMKKFAEIFSGTTRRKIHFNQFYRLRRNQVNAVYNEIESFRFRPKVSIVMPVYNVKKQFLVEVINSVKGQYYTDWELCIVDDASSAGHIRTVLGKFAAKDSRIRVCCLDKNLGISGASKKALEMCTGEYVALLDNDDALLPDALYEVVKKLQNKHYDFIYTDNAMIDEKGKVLSFGYKPEWSPEFFLSTCYTTHFRVFSSKILSQIDAFSDKYKGAQDIDLICRVVEKTKDIGHLSKALYMWRVSKSSVTSSVDAKPYIIKNSMKAYNDHLKRRGIKAAVEWPKYCREKKIGAFKIRTVRSKDTPIVIFARTDIDLNFIYRIVDKTEDCGLVYIVLPRGEKIKVRLSDKYISKIRLVRMKADADFLKLIRRIKSEHICFLDQNLKALNKKWLNDLVTYAGLDRDIAVVGGKILTNFNTVIYGAYLGIGGRIHRMNSGSVNDECGNWFNNKLASNVVAVSGFCMLVRKDVLIKEKGFNFKKYEDLAYIDFCLRVFGKGLRIVFNPWCEFILEKDHSIVKRKNLQKFEKSHASVLIEDPFYNPNFSKHRCFGL
jgi:glycosyltransferase involved in cell wall biosynthesis